MRGHIGIVACAAGGEARCYRLLHANGTEPVGARARPEISMHVHSTSEYAKFIAAGDWPRVADLMLYSASKLAKIGIDFLICPADTLHCALPRVEPRSPLPWLHMADAIAAEALRRSFLRLGLIGRHCLVESATYQGKLLAHGLKLVRPNAAAQDEIDRVIVDELAHGVLKLDTIIYLQRVMERMKAESCDAAVLGCSEVSLLMDDSNSPLPTLDSTTVLARAALHRAG